MKIKIKISDLLLGVIIYAILYLGIVVFYTLLNFNPSIDSTLAFRLHEETKNNEARILEYRNFSKSIVDHFVNKQSVLQMVDRYNHAGKNEKEACRQQLYDSLGMVYQVIKQKNYDIFNFYDLHGKNIVRFHNAKKFGDNLTESRRSIKRMTKNHRYIEGFEEDSFSNSYRFIYPLFYHGNYIGSVELSVSMLKILMEEENSFVGAFRFLLKNEVYKKIVNSNTEENFHDFNVSGYKMYGAVNRKYEKNKFLTDSTFQTLNKMVKKEVMEVESKEKPTIKYIRFNGLNWLITFFPVKNISGEQVALIASYEIYYPIDFLRKGKRVSFLVGAVFSFLITLFFLLINKERREAINRHHAIQKAKEKAEEVARLKSSFLANMSHEIRTPMNGVVGMTEILKHTGLREDQKEFVSIIESSARSLLNVINDILDFSKIDSNKIEIESISFQVRKVIEDVGDTLLLPVEKKGISMLVYTDPAIPEALIGDPLRLRQVILNLANNAVKFTSEGEVLVSAELIPPDSGNTDDSKATVLFKVKDTGIGISEEAQVKLFEAFVQADATINRKYGGTGLGLTISKQLVELMGGNLELKSEMGKGSTFSFQITFEVDKKITTEYFAEAEDLSRLRALVLDDNHSNRIIFKKYFSFWNIHNDEASNVDEAIEKVKESIRNKKPYNLILVDFQMPEKSGFDFADALLKENIKGNTKLILFSSISDMIRSDTIYKNGFDAYLYKPIKYQPFRKVIFETINYQVDKNITESGIKNETGIVHEESELKILLAEDNLVNQKVASVTLNKLGYINVDIANNGTEAVQMHLNNHYDLILMDIQMPIMSGLEATKKIREYEKANPDIDRVRIVALTANALENDVKLYLSEGLDSVLTKPFKPNDLKEILAS